MSQYMQGAIWEQVGLAAARQHAHRLPQREHKGAADRIWPASLLKEATKRGDLETAPFQCQ